LAREGGCLEAIRYCQEQGAEFVVLSLGAEGALVGVGKRRWRAIPPPVKAVNPIGSGDAMMACLAVGLLQGQSFEEMIRLAVGAGVANAVMWDAASCTAEDIARYSLDVRLKEYNI
jgi:tagatose 6-phosphate kinase